MAKVNLGVFIAEVDNKDELTLPVRMGLFNMMLEARKRLAGAVLWRGARRYGSDAFTKCINTYFRNDFDPNSDDHANAQNYDRAVNTAISGLMTIQEHLRSPDVVVTCLPREKMDSAAGMVMFNPVSVLRDKMKGPDPERKMGAVGNIRINYNDIGSTVVAAHTLIHEASHLWLGTRDWGYHYGWDMLSYEEDWRNMGGDVPGLNFIYPEATRGPRVGGKNYPTKVRGKGTSSVKAWYEMTTAEALNNADSYSGFAVRVSEITLAGPLKPLLS